MNTPARAGCTSLVTVGVGRDKIRRELKLSAPSIREKGQEKGKEPKATQRNLGSQREKNPRAEKDPRRRSFIMTWPWTATSILDRSLGYFGSPLQLGHLEEQEPGCVFYCATAYWHRQEGPSGFALRRVRSAVAGLRDSTTKLAPGSWAGTWLSFRRFPAVRPFSPVPCKRFGYLPTRN